MSAELAASMLSDSEFSTPPPQPHKKNPTTMLLSERKMDFLRAEKDQDEMMQSLYGIGRIWARGNKPTVLTVLAFISTLMKAAERLVLRDGDGEHKTKVVHTVLQLVLNDETLVHYDSEEDKIAVLALANSWAPGVIEWGVGLIHDPVGTVGKFSKAFGQLSACCIPPAQRKPKKVVEL
jgi:hypothetical protein